MSRLPVVRGAQVVKALQRAGFVIRRQRGSHVVMQHLERRVVVSVPVHAGEDMPVGTLKRILDKVGLNAEEFRQLLR